MTRRRCCDLRCTLLHRIVLCPACQGRDRIPIRLNIGAGRGSLDALTLRHMGGTDMNSWKDKRSGGNGGALSFNVTAIASFDFRYLKFKIWKIHCSFLTPITPISVCQILNLSCGKTGWTERMSITNTREVFASIAFPRSNCLVSSPTVLTFLLD